MPAWKAHRSDCRTERSTLQTGSIASVHELASRNDSTSPCLRNRPANHRRAGAAGLGTIGDRPGHQGRTRLCAVMEPVPVIGCAANSIDSAREGSLPSLRLEPHAVFLDRTDKVAISPSLTMTMWLPLCRATCHPSDSNTRTTSRPLRTGSEDATRRLPQLVGSR